MTTATGKLLVLTTCETGRQAATMARILVEERLAACVNIVPGIKSVYRWQGGIVSSDEQVLLIKSTNDRYPALEHRLRQIHPYELPEIVAVKFSHGLPDYLDWLAKETTREMTRQ